MKHTKPNSFRIPRFSAISGSLAFLFVAALGLFLPTADIHGQLNILNGLSVSSYEIQGEVPNDPETTSLSFNSTSNASFDPELLLGMLNGDGITATNWGLEAVAADFSSVMPSTHNAIGLQVVPLSGTLTSTDSFSGNFVLDFSNTLSLTGVNPSLGLSTNATLESAVLTPSIGASINLLTTPLGTQFASGEYTLTLSGTVLDTTTEGASVAIIFASVPEPALSSCLMGLGVLALAAVRRRKV